MPFVTIAHLVKDYTDGARQHTVLKDVSFTLERGEIVALMGVFGAAGALAVFAALGQLRRIPASQELRQE